MSSYMINGQKIPLSVWDDYNRKLEEDANRKWDAAIGIAVNSCKPGGIVYLDNAGQVSSHNDRMLSRVNKIVIGASPIEHPQVSGLRIATDAINNILNAANMYCDEMVIDLDSINMTFLTQDIKTYDVNEDGVARAAYATGYAISNKEISQGHAGEIKISYKFVKVGAWSMEVSALEWEEEEDWIMKEADEIVI